MFRVFTVLFTLAIGLGLYAQTESEKKAILKTIEKAYVQGLQNGKEIDNINKGFHPGFNLLGVDQGNNLTKYPIYTWEAGVRKRVEAGQLPPVETTAKYPLVDITGNAAIVKVELFKEGKQIFTDYLSLYKFEEGWRIVAKVYNRTPQE
ncbi:MAG: nuclear transport factor 2 family protein [Bacteroidales bacterium]|nr:nuclear transport factor 2 family protein [Bacteroidales bacterium]